LIDSGTRPTALADTNIFVALLAGPTHALHDRSRELFRRVADGRLTLIVTPVILAELVYACRTVLGWSRPVTAERLATLLRADGLAVREQATLTSALHLFGRHRRLDLPDAYIAATALVAGPPLVASFDRDFDLIDGVVRVG
jgi:predicted nucleic acid-binding protein